MYCNTCVYMQAGVLDSSEGKTIQAVNTHVLILISA